MTPDKKEHRYTQMNTDTHRWNDARANPWFTVLMNPESRA